MAIDKIIPGDAQEELIKQAGCLIRVYESGRHIKCAASPVFTRAELEAHAPPKGHFLTHAITMGSSDLYGANRNCWFTGEPVRTPRGFRQIEDIKKGDVIIDKDGKPGKVTKTFSRMYSGVAVKVKAQGLPVALRGTQEHPLWALPKEHVTLDKLYKRSGKGRKRPGSAFASSVFDQAVSGYADWRELKDIRPGDWLGVPFGEAAEYPDIFPADAWAYGLFLADGCTYREYRDLSNRMLEKGAVFTLGQGDDECVIPHLLKEINRHGNKSSVLESYTSEKGRRIQWGNQKFARSCTRLFGSGATRKTLTSGIFALSRTDKLKLLAGWFDGDGNLITTGALKYRGTLVGSTASLDLACSAQRLLASVGIPSSVSEGTNKLENGCFGSADSKIYQLSVGPSYSDSILEHGKRLRPHGRQVKTKVTQRISNGMLWFRVGSVYFEETEEMCFNFEVEGSHSYVTLVAGHNCDDWPDEELRAHHGTFVTHGRNYREHDNDDPKKALGKIAAEKYDTKLQRGEILFHTKIALAEREFEKARAGEEQHGSMAASVDHDLCECCGFKSKTASERCDHIRDTPGAWLPKFQKYAHMINIEPTFKDYSWVGRPADRIAHTLHYLMPLDKAASASRELRGDELAEVYGMTRNPWLPWLKKIAAFDAAYQPDPARQAAQQTVFNRAFAGELDSECLDKMAHHAYPGRVLRSLQKRSMVLPLASFTAWINGMSLQASQSSDVVKEASAALPAIRAKLACSLDCHNPEASGVFSTAVGQFEPMEAGCDDVVDMFMDKAREQFSLRYEALAKRACMNPLKIASVSTAAPSPEAFGLGALYTAYLCKVAASHDDDWMVHGQLAALR